MKYINFLKNPRKFINDKASKIAEQKIRKQNFIPINKTDENDIFIAGFPKSGNTWIQNLITSILLESTSQRLTPRLVYEIVPDVHIKYYYKRFFPIMFFKTHHLPKPQYKKVIHLVRDGRDAMVSYHKMMINQNKDYPYSLEDMVIDGKGVFPTKWHIHTKQWLQNPFKAEIITVRYEDLLTNPLKELKKICSFANLTISEKLLLEIVESNKIDNLRKRVIIYGTENEDIYKNKHFSTFFRKGIIGDYKNIMSTELIKFFNNEAQNELKHFNYNI